MTRWQRRLRNELDRVARGGSPTDEQVVSLEADPRQPQSIRALLRLGVWPDETTIATPNALREAQARRVRELATLPAALILFPFRDPYRDLYEWVIGPACHWEGLRPVVLDREAAGTLTAIGKAREAMRAAALYIADVSAWNVNVCYEIGFMDALGKPGVLLSSKTRARQPHYLKDREVSPMSTGLDATARNRTKLRAELARIRGS
jgi:hypothetical protein